MRATLWCKLIDRGLVAMAMTVVLAGTVGAAPSQFVGTGHYYEVISEPDGIDWESADSAALAQGGYLATITSEAENAFAYSLAALDEDYWTPGRGTTSVGPWLGGFQPEDSPEPDGNWQWVTGEPFAYTHWGGGEPNNGFHGGYENRVHFWSGSSLMEPLWNDLYAFDEVAPHAYIVEWVPEPTTLALAALGGLGLLVSRQRK